MFVLFWLLAGICESTENLVPTLLYLAADCCGNHSAQGPAAAPTWGINGSETAKILCFTYPYSTSPPQGKPDISPFLQCWREHTWKETKQSPGVLWGPVCSSLLPLGAAVVRV